MRVIGHDGRQWQVRRRWLTCRRPRWRGDRDVDLDGGLDVLDFADDPVSIVVGLVVVVAGLFLLSVFVLPLLLFLGELLLLIPLALLGVAGRLLLRRPWTVQASSGRTVVRRQAAGWTASQREIARLASEIRRGELV